MKKQLLIAFCLIMGFTGCGMTKEPVNLHDEIPDFEYLAKHGETSGSKRYVGIEKQLLAWHPYGSSFEALKQRIISGGGRYVGLSSGKWSCEAYGGAPVGCKESFNMHIMDALNRYMTFSIGEENGRIVYLKVKYYNKYL